MKYKLINSKIAIDAFSGKDESFCNSTPKGAPPDVDTKKDDDDDERRSTSSDCPLLLSYNEAPSYLKFNPYIRTGYRGLMDTKMCLESIFWWTNETINIWSHIFGWMLFLGLTLYDLMLLNIHASFADKFIVGLLLACFQACMILSSAYHTFSCKSEKTYSCFLSYDLFGIALSLLAIYMSGIYYAFWCYKDWCKFYMLSVGLIFVLAMLMQLPRLNVDSNVKLAVFVSWAAYGILPTLHWTFIMGGLDNPLVKLLLPRVVGMYAICALAFFMYISKIPERFFEADMSSSSYKLIYFNARGKAEHIRFIFAYAGVEYKDERIPRDKWPQLKKTMPFGMVPALEVDGRVIGQSNAIARFLARRHGLTGRDEWESLQCDTLVDTLSDLKQALFQYRLEPDPFKKEEKKQTLMKETIPFYLNKFEKVITENDGYSVGGALTWTDFVFAVSLENFELIFGKDSLEPYPMLKALKEKVFSLPSIQEWLQKRPATEF